MPAVIYARFSDRPGAESCESIEAQLERCRAFCGSRSLKVRLETSDRAKSGADGLNERPGLLEALESLSKGDVLVVARRDRLARGVMLMCILEREIESSGATVLSAAGEGTESQNPESKLIRHVLDAVAEYERELIRLRTKLAMRRHQATGRRMSSKLPYGMKNDPENASRMLPEPLEQAVIERIKALRSEGLALRHICETLTLEGLTCRGGPWHHKTIGQILAR